MNEVSKHQTPLNPFGVLTFFRRRPILNHENEWRTSVAKGCPREQARIAKKLL